MPQLEQAVHGKLDAEGVVDCHHVSEVYVPHIRDKNGGDHFLVQQSPDPFQVELYFGKNEDPENVQAGEISYAVYLSVGVVVVGYHGDHAVPAFAESAAEGFDDAVVILGVHLGEDDADGARPRVFAVEMIGVVSHLARDGAYTQSRFPVQLDRSPYRFRYRSACRARGPRNVFHGHVRGFRSCQGDLPPFSLPHSVAVLLGLYLFFRHYLIINDCACQGKKRFFSKLILD